MKTFFRFRHSGYFCILFCIVFCLLSVPSFASEILSRSVVVMNSSTGEILYAKNPDLQSPPASTTKLMTAIITLENADLSDVVTVSRNASSVPPHKAGFREGEQITVEHLLYAALVYSANDAAVALAEAVSGSEERFAALMNRKAVSLGAFDTRFVNSSGLPGEGQQTTAYDLAKIMQYALRHHKLKEIINTRFATISTEDGESFSFRNTNRLLWSGEDILGGKTGYTRKALHCFVCAVERNSETLIVAVLGSASRDTLWRETEALIAKGFSVLENMELPVIYVSRTHEDKDDIRKSPQKKKQKVKSASAKTGKDRKVLAQKKGTHKKSVLTAKKKGKSKMLAKKKSKTYARGTHKGKKNFSIAEKRTSIPHKG